MTVIIGLLQFVGATVILIYGVEESSTLTTELNEYLIKLVYDWDNDPKAAAVLKQIMEYVSWKSEVENDYEKAFVSLTRARNVARILTEIFPIR